MLLQLLTTPEVHWKIVLIDAHPATAGVAYSLTVKDPEMNYIGILLSKSRSLTFALRPVDLWQESAASSGSHPPTPSIPGCDLGHLIA